MDVWDKFRNWGFAKQNLTVDAAEVPVGAKAVEGKKEVAKSEQAFGKKKGGAVARKTADKGQKVADQGHVAIAVPDDNPGNVQQTMFSEESNFIKDLNEAQKIALQDFKEKIEALIKGNGFAIPQRVELAINAAEETSPPTSGDAKSAVNDAAADTMESTEVLNGAGTAVPVESETKEVEAVTAGAPVVEALGDLMPAPEVEFVVEATPTQEVEALVETAPAAEVEAPVETAPAPEVKATVETAPAPEVEACVDAIQAAQAKVPMETTPAPEDEATADVTTCEVESKEAGSETAIEELEETAKEEAATKTIVEEPIDNTPPLEENKGNPEDVCLWGVPLLQTKGDERTDVILLKFLRAREFQVNEACDMLVNTIKWRQSFWATTILEKELQSTLDECFYMQGNDIKGHPVCYNIWGAFQDNDLFQKMLGNASNMESFKRWRVQLLEKAIQQLDFTPGGTSAMLLVNDLKNIPLLKKEMRDAIEEVISLLEDNYPELVVKNVCLNPPWYFNAWYNFINPFITPRMKGKIVLARPGQIFKSIAPEIVPVQYGGFAQRNNMAESTGLTQPSPLILGLSESSIQELSIQAGKKESIEIAMEQAGSTTVWDLSVIGWDVTFGVEFASMAPELDRIIVKKTKRLLSVEQPIRGKYLCLRPGKLVLSIRNTALQKKLVFYRFKVEVPGAVAEL